MGTYLPVAGNVGIFSHYDDEYRALTLLREELADSTDAVYGKYFRLHEPIVISGSGDIPSTTYSYLYIRKPDADKPQTGDIDFFMEPTKYIQLKQSLMEGKVVSGARLLPDRPDLDLIELYDPQIDAFGYIGDKRWSTSP
jgi:hypothetical protein